MWRSGVFLSAIMARATGECPAWCAGNNCGGSRNQPCCSVAADLCSSPCVACGKPAVEVAVPSANGQSSDACLCIFDVDRTLTARQGSQDRCQSTSRQPGVRDYAYGGGELQLSAVALHLSETACARSCYIGVLTAGDASGATSAEAQLLWRTFHGLPHGVGRTTTMGQTPWVMAGTLGPHTASTPLVIRAGDGQKQQWVPNILAYYRRIGISISNDRIHFFDDRMSNVLGFAGTPWHARQVRAHSRLRGGLESSLRSHACPAFPAAIGRLFL